MTALLRVECVAKSFEGRRVLSAASLRATPGKLTALLGRNGAGKSTLLKIAAGCLRPDAGSTCFAGQTHWAPRRDMLAREGMFYLPDQDLFSDAFTVRHQLAMLQAQFDGAEVGAVAEQLDIASFLDCHAYQLSGGERRRCELAAVLVRRPRCLLADEPYRGIAPLDAERVSTIFRECVSRGIAVVVTGHEVATLLDVADEICWCTSGTTYQLGTPAQAMEREAFAREYLGLRRGKVAGIALPA